MHLSDSIIGRINGLKFILSPFKRSRDEILHFQQSQMRRIINHAYYNVPYYRRLFDSNGVRPQDIRSLDDLRHVPVTSKKDLISLPSRDVITAGINESRLLTYTTSSTSGIPSTSRRTWIEQRINDYVRWRAKYHMGLRPGDTVALVHFIYEHGAVEKSSHMWGISDLFQIHEINCLDPPEAILNKLKCLNPDVIIGYPGVLIRVADLTLEHSEQTLSPRLVVSGGEVLSPHMRSVIDNAFSTRVFNNYGCTEVNQIGWECRKTGHFHVCDDNIIVEIVKNGQMVNEGEAGEVVITTLNAFAAPLIRYCPGDIAWRGPDQCSCGAQWSVLGEVEGRKVDYFVLPDGRLMHAWKLFDPIFMHAYDWIRQYQIVQEKRDLVVLRLVPRKYSWPEEIKRLKAGIMKELGSGIEFKVLITEKIPPLPNGKYANYVSLVSEE